MGGHSTIMNYFLQGVLLCNGFSLLSSKIHGNVFRNNNNHLNSVDPERYGSNRGTGSIAVANFVEFVSRDIPTDPLFFGFFYDYNVSLSLRLITEKYLATCYDRVKDFANFVDKAMATANVTDIFAYYMKPLDPATGKLDPYYHTTTKFCGRKDCMEYWNKAGKLLGKTFDMHLVGLFFTTRTYGLRVKLTPEEQNIFDMDERKNSVQAVEKVGNLTQLLRRPISVNESVLYEGYFTRRQPEGMKHPLYPGIYFVPQSMDFHPTESRAHATVGCAPNVEAQQTGLDLLQIIDLEISKHVEHVDFSVGGSDVPVSVLRKYGKAGHQTDEEVFVIYPSEKMVTQATFSVYL